MEKISFKLEVFEGPMDLLLNLISKHKLNIYDIEISSLLEQYLIYLEQARDYNLELAGEFLEMAARLILIKTVSLLPKPNDAGDKISVRKPMKINIPSKYERKHAPDELYNAFISMGKKLIEKEKKPTDKLQAVVNRSFVSVMSKVIYVLRSLHKNEHVYLDAMYAEIRDRSSRVALFLAVLELTKHGKIYISDDNTYLYRKNKQYYKDDSPLTYEEEETWNIHAQ